MQSQQIMAQNFISYIKNISLHFQNLFAPTQQDLKGITNKTFKLISDFQKFVSEYNQKVLKQIQNAKITVPLIFYRSIKDNVNDPAFMKYEFKGYELKFIFIRINLECHVHVQIFKNTSGVKKSCLAFQKLQNGFIYLLYKKLTEQKQSATVSVKFLEDNARIFLEEVYQVMNGEILCARCRKTMSYHNDLKSLLPPTIRLENFKDKKELQMDTISTVKYVHEGCI